MAVSASEAQDLRAVRARERARQRCTATPGPCAVCYLAELRKEGLA